MNEQLTISLHRTTAYAQGRCNCTSEYPFARCNSTDSACRRSISLNRLPIGFVGARYTSREEAVEQLGEFGGRLWDGLVEGKVDGGFW